MRKIDIFDTTLRDGEQAAGINLNTAEKLEIARQLERFGATIIEAGFPASSPGDFEAVQRIANTVKNSTVTGLARTVTKDIDTSWEALKGAEQPHIHIFLATSPIHMNYKLKKSPEEVVELAVDAVKYARKKFPLVQWSAEDAFRSDPDFLVHIVNKVIAAGATTINIPDTVGYATPVEYGALFKYLKENVTGIDKVKLSAHCHNDLGMATANTIAAIENGADQIEGTINGIGERAGNVALEEIAVALHIRKDIYGFDTDVNLQEIKRTSQLVSQLTGVVIQPNKAIVGKNAFAHESGIHQDGMLKNPETYEIITPELIGEKAVPLALGKHSGRHAFKDRAISMGFDLSEEKLNEAFVAFKELADRKKEITEDDLFVLFTDQQIDSGDTPIYELTNVQVQYGTANIPTATVSAIAPNGETISKAATGSGSVEAIFNTLEELVQGKVHILDYRVTSIGKGRDALGEALVNLSYNGQVSTGRDVAQDVLEASAKAYLNAINRQLIKADVRVKEASVTS
ncbi:2-isopropylmalate synthase [Sporosarcina pasteurii]|uniref:2-isopropylmalate synthase n=1 Tax=Sporosarcina pasteurii TaxID=1474 RepID=A0A380BC50_SPOPA|nr:2-isopropylmalate synthase [Sporosarcina pasteurii]MDS9472390.1 2-isopropylmalate synthase [Sporosarcina pasteurii]QBQ06367.1 2-isopropylmalate synthase [Sporosarcina pasteurii]SUI98890.1 2-isopropylmalate synthase [Sporosarcina pasteurii]